jgi:inhibitor of KinA
MKITPLGDSALLLDLEPEANGPAGKTLRRVLSIKRAIERAKIPGLIECSSSYQTVAAFFDPLASKSQGVEAGAAGSWFESRLRKAAASGKSAPRFRFRKLEIPFCADPEFAFDLAEVASRAGLSEAEVIQQYCATLFQVMSVGFTPGFPYLAGLPEKLACARRSSPRLSIPEGSVAIGGNQAGIYSMASPGGWNVIGRTPLTLFAPENPPTLLRPGDHVRFRAISRAEFEILRETADADATSWK